MDGSLSALTRTTEGKGYRGENLAFIIGAPRSGTTWLQRLLASHPRIRTGQESHVFTWYLAPMMQKWRSTTARFDDTSGMDRQGLGLAGYLSETEFEDLLRAFILKMLAAASVREGDWFIEKTPSHALFVKEIHRLLPECRFIHLVRDPRDVVSSLLAASKSWGKVWAPDEPSKAAKLWVRHVKAAAAAGDEMAPEQFMTLRYEDLHEDPHEQLNHIAAFLGLEWTTEEMSEAIQINAIENARKGGGTPIPVYGYLGKRSGSVAQEPDGFVRKGKPGAGSQELNPLQQFEVWEIVYPYLAMFGYEWKASYRAHRERGRSRRRRSKLLWGIAHTLKRHAYSAIGDIRVLINEY